MEFDSDVAKQWLAALAKSGALAVVVPFATLVVIGALGSAALWTKLSWLRAGGKAAESGGEFARLSLRPNEEKKEDWREITDTYYSTSTLFYLHMYGDALHFAPRMRGETWPESMRRHEYALALRLGLKPGHKVLDAGCGLGGPGRAISRFSGAHVTGVNINALQVDMGNKLSEAKGVRPDQFTATQADFTKMGMFQAGSFDAAYAIEATCHAPDRKEVFGEIFRVLKPGGNFACYEWVLTASHDPKNPAHIEAKENIERGNGLAELTDTAHVVAALRHAGFVVEQVEDLAASSEEPWWLPWKDEPYFSAQAWRSSAPGFIALYLALWLQALVGLIPHSVFEGLHTMTRGPIGLVRGAEHKTFTPMLLLVARKPAAGSGGAGAGAAAGFSPRAASPTSSAASTPGGGRRRSGSITGGKRK